MSLHPTIIITTHRFINDDGIVDKHFDFIIPKDYSNRTLLPVNRLYLKVQSVVFLKHDSLVVR